jgi:hypothetical protein
VVRPRESVSEPGEQAGESGEPDGVIHDRGKSTQLAGRTSCPYHILWCENSLHHTL